MNMGKIFKFLGIGTAIGTVVYGVIKCKNDQKFKEKVDGVTEKVVEKACDFTVSHPKAALGIVVGTVVGGSVLSTIAVGKGITSCSEKLVKRPIMTDKQRAQLAKWSKENGYDDRLEIVKDLVKDIDLQDNEVFSFAQYNDDGGDRKTCVYQSCVKDGRTYERADFI